MAVDVLGVEVMRGRQSGVVRQAVTVEVWPECAVLVDVQETVEIDILTGIELAVAIDVLVPLVQLEGVELTVLRKAARRQGATEAPTRNCTYRGRLLGREAYHSS